MLNYGISHADMLEISYLNTEPSKCIIHILFSRLYASSVCIYLRFMLNNDLVHLLFILNLLPNKEFENEKILYCPNWPQITELESPVLPLRYHYIDVIMTTMASQITSLTVVYLIVYSGADQRKHHSSASLAFVRGIHRDRWIPRTNGQ